MEGNENSLIGDDEENLVQGHSSLFKGKDSCEK